MGKLLVVLVLMIGVIAIAQMVRVYEMSSKLRGKKEEEISNSDNVFNARMMIVFMVFFYSLFIWLLCAYGDGGKGPSAAVHGETLDWLLNFNFLIIIIVFFVTNTLLFFFSYKYYYRPDRKGYWFPHNNKLELLWTSVPAVVLTVIIILGLRAWNEITDNAGKNAVVVELYSKQFDWTARYSGEDNKLGRADFRMNNSENPLGVLTNEGMSKRLNELRAEAAGVFMGYYLHTWNDEAIAKLSPKAMGTYMDTIKARVAAAKEIGDGASVILSSKKLAETKDKYERLQRHIIKLLAVEKTISDKDNVAAMDDRVAKELYLIKGKEYEFKMRSMDVIHSAYFPHFRAQMNTVPGMVTRFKFTPRYTTTEMRKIMDNSKFDYVLLCNKICGSAHSNMQMKIIVVEDEKEVKNWLAQQKSVKEILFPAEAAPAPEAAPADTAAKPANVVALNK